MSVRSEDVLWLFDLGNSSLKGRCVGGATVGPTVRMDWDSPRLDASLHELLGQWPGPSRILIASVASTPREDHLRRVLPRCPAGIHWLVSPRSGCGIVNSYQVPERLGIDRFLAMVGARAITHGAPLIMVGCGTALTLDAVDAAGRQLAGMLAPSPHLMLQSFGETSIVDATDPGGRNDGSKADADDPCKEMDLGCWTMAVALIESFCARHNDEFGEISLFLHGGGAPSLKLALDSGSSVRARMVDDVIWRGMQEWVASTAAGSTGSAC